VALALFAAVGCHADPVMLDRIIVVVNQDVILESELEARKRFMLNQLDPAQRPGLADSAVMEKQVLDQLILTRLQLQLARVNEISMGDEEIDRMLQQVAERNGLSVPEFRATLERDGFNFQQFREDLHNEMVINRLRGQHVDRNVSVSEPEVNYYLTTLEHQGQIGDEYRLRHILLRRDPAAADDSALEARARDISERLAAGTDFAVLALEYSAAADATSGGDLGWRKRNEIPSMFAEVVPILRPGETSAPIRGERGLHLVQLVEVRTSGQVMQEQLRARHILLTPGEQWDEAQVRTLLGELRARILAGEDFATLAREFSQDLVSSVKGGDLGWINRGQLDAAFEQKLDELGVGELSEPLRSSAGWHLVEVQERRRQDTTDETRQQQAREALMQRKMEEARQAWLNQLFDEAYIEYRLPGQEEQG